MAGGSTFIHQLRPQLLWSLVCTTASTVSVRNATKKGCVVMIDLAEFIDNLLRDIMQKWCSKYGMTYHMFDGCMHGLYGAHRLGNRWLLRRQYNIL